METYRCLHIKVLSLFILLLLLFPSILLAAGEKNLQQCEVAEVGSVTYLRNIDEFEFVGGGAERYDPTKEIYKLKSEDDARFLVKNLLHDGSGYVSYDDLVDMRVVYDFLGAFILRKIIGNRVPVNYLVELENGRVVLASEFIQDFVTVDEHVMQLYSDADEEDQYKVEMFWSAGCAREEIFIYPPKCNVGSFFIRELCLSKEYIETFRLFEFIDMSDNHDSNIGFIIRDGRIVDSAIIDFKSSLLGEKIDKDKISKNIKRRYYSGIDNALLSLRLISTFEVDFLDELYHLFEQLEKKKALDEVKKFMQKKLVGVNKQIEFCELAKKIIAGDCGIEEFDRLINIGVSLDRLTIWYNENILMNLLYDKEDISRIVTTLNKEPVLMPTFIEYCLKHFKCELLNEVVARLDKSTVEVMEEMLKRIKQCNYKLI